jgi:hypothetical protein
MDETRAVIEEILALSRRAFGWDTYRGAKVDPQAQQMAIRIVDSFPLLGYVPRPMVGLAPDGGVILQWLTSDREIDLHFHAGGGDYLVARRGSDEVIEEDSLHGRDVLKAIIAPHVLGRRSVAI